MHIIIVLLLIWSSSKAQFVVDSLALDTFSQLKEIDPIEVNFLFSYYEQDGTKSPVTGGIGDEALTDMVGNISLNIPIKNNLKFNFLGGIDMYSSASTDNINNEYGLYTETSASSHDNRVHGNLGVEFNNDKKRISYGFGVGASSEFDVKSYNYNAFFSKLTKNRNTLLYLKGSAYTDNWLLIYPSELRWENSLVKGNLSNNVRNTYNGMFSIAQDITPRMKASITFETIYQYGLLSTPFHRVYFFDSNTHDIERLPDNRLKLPIGMYWNYYINKYLVVRLFYRYYFDDFGIKAQTAAVELPIKPKQSFAIIPFYRYHTQTASKYFNQFGFSSINDNYYTSDFDLANIKSDRIGMEFRFAPFIAKKGDPTKKRIMFKKVSLRASKYFRSREKELILQSYIVAMELSFRIE